MEILKSQRQWDVMSEGKEVEEFGGPRPGHTGAMEVELMLIRAEGCQPTLSVTHVENRGV